MTSFSISLILFLVVALFASIVTIIYFTRNFDQPNTGCFRAAVLDHFPISAKNVDENLKLTFLTFVEATKLAKENNADLIVFPESALMNPIPNRSAALNYAIEMPNKFPFDLCYDEGQIKNESLPIHMRFSCLAKSQSIYIVAQMLDKQKCFIYDPNANCTSDGYFIFNTAIMFDKFGRMIAKYHKMQPFGEMNYNTPTHDELVYVDTEIGRIGLQICFDLIYEKPGHYLVSNNTFNVDTIVFPTNWFNEAPFLSASQYQMAWAFGNKVNLLSSNMHYPKIGSVGSGIYSGTGNEFLNANFANDTGERLLISNLVKKPRQKKPAICNRENKIISLSPSNQTEYRYLQMNSSNVEMIMLTDNSNNSTLTHHGVHCYVEYEANFTMLLRDKQGYFLLASNRTRPNLYYTWWEEFCAVVFCKLDLKGRCQQYQTNNFETFNWIKLIGTFSSNTIIYPSVIENNHKPVDKLFWNFEELSQDNKITNKQFWIEFGDKNYYKHLPISTLSLYGRNYQRDPKFKQVPVHQEIVN